MTRRIMTILAAAVLLLLLAACGGEGDPEATAVLVPLEVEEAPESGPAPAEVEDTAAASGGQVAIFRISADESAVRFEIDEVLRGADTTAVGSTNQVAGEIAFDPADLSTAQVGTITISAASITTDSSLRDRAIRNFILQSGLFPEVTFSPTAIAGLPDSVAPGETATFTITGDLTIRDQTVPATFEVSATLESDGRLVGTASTTISRADFGLTIPDVPAVASVEETVDLYIDFVATAG